MYNILALILTPIYKLLGKIFNQKPSKVVIKSEEAKELIGNATPVVVTDGQSTVNCMLELKNTGNGMKALFRYKSKVLVSDIYESPKQAINEISAKLRENNLVLRICSNCSHFGFKPNSKTTTQIGLCSEKNHMIEDIQSETSLLNSCVHHELLADLKNVVNMKEHLENVVQNNTPDE